MISIAGIAEGLWIGMADREKVIYDIERCICHVPDACRDCSHYKHGEYLDCMEELLSDALELLKEQEDLGTELTNAVELIHKKNERIEKLLKEQDAVKPVLDEQTGRIWLCGKCGSYVGFEDNDPHDPNEFDKYCRDCGRPVLWEGR